MRCCTDPRFIVVAEIKNSLSKRITAFFPLAVGELKSTVLSKNECTRVVKLLMVFENHHYNLKPVLTLCCADLPV